LIAREPQRALATVNDALAMLDRQLPLHPQDALLQLIRAYSYKNQAIALDALGKSSASQQALERAERSFQVMRDELEANTASAYNGLGSVQAMRGNLRDSLRWIDRALALRPDYAEALRDRAAVKRELARRPRPARSKPKSTRRRGQPRRRR
jgi:tetratricopeptide (TPR) repeat protein